jgi:hypothetical protein
MLLSLRSHHSSATMLRQLNSVDTLVPNIDEIHFNIIPACTLDFASDFLLYMMLLFV